jgi:hypothetical protein
MTRILAAVGALVALAGCAAERVKLRVVVPSKTKVVGVKGIAIGGFKAENLDAWRAESGGGGGWSRSRLPDGELSAIAAGVKNDLMGALAETPHYAIVDIEGMDAIYDMDDLAGLVGKPTFKPGEVDALVFGRCWVGYLEAGGERIEKHTLEHWTYRQNPAQLVGAREELVRSDYRTASAVLVVQYTAIRIKPRLEILFVTTTAQSLRQDEGGGVVVSTTRGGLGFLMGLGRGGASEGKTETAGGKPAGGTVPLPLEAFSYLSHEAAIAFVEQISPTTAEYELEIADGDETAQNLLKAGAYREASRRLAEITKGSKPGTVKYRTEKDRAPDLFNLGLAYEAQGPLYYEDAVLAYKQAVEADPEEAEYATGLGRIESFIEGRMAIEAGRASE